MSLLAWIKNHKLNTLLIAIISLLLWIILPTLFRSNTTSFQTPSIQQSPSIGTADTEIGSFDSSSVPFKSLTPGFQLDRKTSEGTTNRIVIKNSNLSLLVKDVRVTGEEILDYTKEIGGYMVSTSYNRPNESPYAEITVRVPTEKLDETLEIFRKKGLKVTSENLLGTDVSEQYVDIEANLVSHEKTKEKYEALLDRATTVTESANIQREITSLQQQIDSYTGLKRSIEENAKLTKITVFLSTDELALPYTPDQTFRPELIFKQAVRSLLNTFRVIGSIIIWVVVYSVIWIPVLVGYYIYRRWKRNRNLTT